jgi:hypothetical protein
MPWSLCFGENLVKYLIAIVYGNPSRSTENAGQYTQRIFRFPPIIFYVHSCFVRWTNPHHYSRYENSITHQRLPDRPIEKGGGILADETGMGKSLSLLALILETLKRGQNWAQHQRIEVDTIKTLRYSRSTLLIVPTPCELKFLLCITPLLIAIKIVHIAKWLAEMKR